MRWFIAFALTAAVAYATDIVTLGDDDFADKITGYEVALVEFYAPWCGHCKKLAPEYEKAATKLVKNDPPVTLVQVDCTAHKATCDKFGVSGFPTLKIFRSGEVSADYDGPREAEGIVKYMRGQVGPSSKELKSAADYEKFTAADEHSVIGFFPEDSKLKDSFQKVADTERDRFRFAHTFDKALCDKYGFNDDIVVIAPKQLHNKFEDAQLKYDGNYDTDKIKKFLNTELHGLAGIRTQDTSASFQRPLVVVYYNVDYVKDPKGTQYWRNRVLKVAKEFVRKVHFAVSNRNDFNFELDEYGLADRKNEVKDKPLVTGMSAAGEKFGMQDDFSVENLQKFAQALLDGKLEPYMKSEPIPDDNSGPVKTLVAKNFKEIVTDSDKDVLIEFYAPWCGHCKKLTPTWDELGEKMQGENVVIAKMDATANDVPPPFSVSGFPTIYWAPKGAKGSPRPYNGGRDIKDFVKFIAKEATDELKGYNRDGKKKKSKSEL